MSGAMPVPKPVLGYKFSVVSGPHAGASETLPLGSYRIGSGIEADIVLVDDSLAPLHGVIELDHDMVRIVAVNGPVAVRRHGSTGRSLTLAAGEEFRSRTAVTITLGTTRLSLRPPLESAKPAALHPLLARPSLRRALAAGVAGLTLLSPLNVDSASSTMGQPLAVKTAPQAAPRSVAPTPRAPEGAARASASAAPAAAPKPGSVEEAAAALRQHLAAQGLGNLIKVTAAADTVTARGALDPKRSADWLAVQKWYDETFAGRPVLIQQVAAAPAAVGPLLSVRAVWTGAHPYIIAGDGEKYGEGAVFEGGWVIEHIDAGRLVMSHDGQSFVLTF